MTYSTYFHWLADQTPTTWWNDSGDPDELAFALAHMASGVTTNPVLAARALPARPDYWRPLAGDIASLTPSERAETLTRVVFANAAALVKDQYDASDHAEGYVCAQVNPNDAGDREAMLEQALRYAAWAPNIAVKLPVTAAGLDVLEECIARGITITATVSFTVPQVVAAAERHRRGAERARAAGITPGHCFAVIMVGRLDSYLHEVALDNRAKATASDIQLAGVAASKNAYRIFQEQGYEARLLIAGLRGIYQVTEMAGADMVISIHPRYQKPLLAAGIAREPRIDAPVATDVMARLLALPEFVRSYEPDGMAPEDFVRYGATQRTLSQFDQVGWSLLESFAW